MLRGGFFHGFPHLVAPFSAINNVGSSLGLGAAATKGVSTSVTSGDSNLVTGDAVFQAINTNSMQFTTAHATFFYNLMYEFDFTSKTFYSESGTTINSSGAILINNAGAVFGKNVLVTSANSSTISNMGTDDYHVMVNNGSRTYKGYFLIAQGTDVFADYRDTMIILYPNSVYRIRMFAFDGMDDGWIDLDEDLNWIRFTTDSDGHIDSAIAETDIKWYALSQSHICERDFDWSSLEKIN